MEEELEESSLALVTMLLLLLGTWPGHSDHGGPLRPITPSWYGTSTLCWMLAMGGAEQSDFQEEGDGSLLGECGEEKEAKEHSQGQVWASGRRSGEAQK